MIDRGLTAEIMVRVRLPIRPTSRGLDAAALPADE